MKKIGTVTFHSAYNYGSNLQAYALQEFCKKIAKESNEEIKYEIINLRQPVQKELYAIYRKSNNFKNIIRNILTIPYKKDIIQKNERFEHFINTKLNVTKEYNSLEEIEKDNLSYDYYISGSDQLWNTTAPDFSWAYYLPFVKSGKKISYAASFGSVGINKEDEQEVKKLLKKYDEISVREIGAKENLKKILKRDVEVNVDPTMLLTKGDWLEIIGDEKNELGDYILFYTLYPNKQVVKLAEQISKKLNLPVVVTKFNNEKDYFNNFKKVYDAGPLEFLKLINNAKLVISSSFHGNIFSILLEKPFFAIKNGKKDMRLETLLQKMNLENRSITEENIDEACEHAFDISFVEAKKILEEESEKSKKYLKRALDINK